MAALEPDFNPAAAPGERHRGRNLPAHSGNTTPANSLDANASSEPNAVKPNTPANSLDANASSKGNAASQNAPEPASGESNAAASGSGSEPGTIGGTANSRQTAEWQEALATAQGIPAALRPSAAELATLARACTAPRQLHLLLAAFARQAAALPPEQTPASTPQLPYALLCDFVDDSAHDLREWINALTVLDDWLRDNNRQPQPLCLLLPYLACSAEAQAASPLRLPLQHTVADMLEHYGYEGEAQV